MYYYKRVRIGGGEEKEGIYKDVKLIVNSGFFLILFLKFIFLKRVVLRLEF